MRPGARARARSIGASVLVASALVGGAACETPAPGLRFRLAGGPSQECPSLNCADVPLTCRTWISIRVLDPADPTVPYLSQCQEVPLNRKRDLCSIASIDLDPISLPIRDLEVQVALYPEDMITTDPDSGDDVCPTNIEYDASNGFPIDSGLTPAVGGRTYYRPGDDEVVVTLGCTNLEMVNDPTCVGAANIHVTATVEDFDTGASVSAIEANRLAIAVGEPHTDNGMYVLQPRDLTQLERVVNVPPAWAIDVEQLFMSYACLTVFDDIAGSTTALTCKAATVTDKVLDFSSKPTGVRLSTTSLDQILAALGLLQFPAGGITIGVVLDSDGKPLANRVVSASGASIQYLSADRNSVGAGSTAGGPMGGVFISVDAPFGTVFSTTGGIPPETPSALGGGVEGKVTVVVLRFTAPVVGGS